MAKKKLLDIDAEQEDTPSPELLADVVAEAVTTDYQKLENDPELSTTAASVTMPGGVSFNEAGISLPPGATVTFTTKAGATTLPLASGALHDSGISISQGTGQTTVSTSALSDYLQRCPAPAVPAKEQSKQHVSAAAAVEFFGASGELLEFSEELADSFVKVNSRHRNRSAVSGEFILTFGDDLYNLTASAIEKLFLLDEFSIKVHQVTNNGETVRTFYYQRCHVTDMTYPDLEAFNPNAEYHSQATFQDVYVNFQKLTLVLPDDLV